MPSKPSRISRRRSNKKWSPVLVNNTVTQSVSANQNYFQTLTLCINSSTTATAPTATVIKCGNFKIVGDVNVSSEFNSSGRMYVMYVPQGFEPTINTPREHPEWILCWRGFEPGINGLQAFSMQSKLKRNLNSGDSVQLVITAANLSTSSVNVAVTATASYVCCAN